MTSPNKHLTDRPGHEPYPNDTGIFAFLLLILVLAAAASPFVFSFWVGTHF